MKQIISQVLFTLTILTSLWLFIKGSTDWYILYFLFYWIWLSFMAIKSVRLSKHWTTTAINLAITGLTLSVDLVVLVLSLGFGTRMILAVNNVYWWVMYGTILVFTLSVIGHIYITTKNIYTANNTNNILTTCLTLLLYPIGIWTVQSTLTKLTKKQHQLTHVW